MSRAVAPDMTRTQARCVGRQRLRGASRDGRRKNIIRRAGPRITGMVAPMAVEGSKGGLRGLIGKLVDTSSPGIASTTPARVRICPDLIEKRFWKSELDGHAKDGRIVRPLQSRP